MIKDIDDEKLIFEIKGLILEIDTIKDEINIYCDLVKQMFLKNSTEN